MTGVRWGVLGAANIALTRVIPAMQATEKVNLLAIASRDLERARRVCALHGVARAYGDYEALLADPDIEVVYIPLPNALHFEWCAKALRAGKHVLCEKPLVLTSSELERLLEIRDQSGCIIEEAFAYRNHPQWADIAAIIDVGEIGAPRLAHAVLAKQFNDFDDIRNDPALGGGALYDLGSYAINAMNQVFRRPPVRVAATMDLDPRFGVDQMTTAVLDYGDAQATFSCNMRAGSDTWGTQQFFHVLAERGWLACDFPFAHGRPNGCRLRIGDDQTVGAIPSRAVSYPALNQYVLQVARFSSLVTGEPAASWPLEDSLLTLRIIEALFAAARSGAWCEMFSLLSRSPPERASAL